MVDEKVAREVGKIKCYLPIKGYGFIQRTSGKDLFFLRTDARSEAELLEGAIVTFSISLEPKGPRARDIRRQG